jgi:hypothetical protein
MGRFATSWRLTLNSFRLLRRNPSLIAFPVIGAGGVLAAIGLVALALFALDPNLYGFPLWAVNHYYILVPALVAAYVLVVLVATFATAALIGASMQALNGQRATVRDGLRSARTHLGPLLLWGLFSATVGLVLQFVASRAGIGGVILRVIGGVAWGLATYFVVPVILFEGGGPRTYIPRSAAIMRDKFANVLFSNLVMGLVLGAGIVLSIGLLVWGVFEIGLYSAPVEGGALLVAGLVLFVGFLILDAAAEGVLQASLYRYATTGKLDPELLGGVFRPT